MQSTGALRWTDLHNNYQHPVTGSEGDSYSLPVTEPLAPLPLPSSDYPPEASVDATGLIVVRNGERYIGAAVRSLRWCKKVVVVDQRSQDRTRSQALLAGAEVIDSEVTGVVEPARRAAVDALGPGWVVMLDADELCPPPLARALASTIEGGSVEAIRMARQNFVFGRWARDRSMWPDRQLRAFRADAVQLPNRVHFPITTAEGARTRDLAAEPGLAIVHLNYTDLADWLDRTNRYTSMQGREIALERKVSGRAAMRGFLRRYLRDGSWRQGRRGLRTAALAGLYEWLLVEKWAELTDGGGVAVAANYDALAQRVVAEGTGWQA
jgi:glycosyltransferase involved in cell wall biosynthesis